MRMGSFQRAEDWGCLEMMPKIQEFQPTFTGSTFAISGQKHKYVGDYIVTEQCDLTSCK